MKGIIYILIFFSSISLFAQESSISIKECRELAKENWPNFKKLQYNQENIDLIDSELSKNYLPKLSFNASATYQSEVVTFPEVPGMVGFFPTLKKDNYNAELRLNQLIYDGGNISSAKELQLASNKLDESIIEVDNYNLMLKINQLYFNVLILSKNENLLKTTKEELEDNIKILQSAFDNGMILSSELNNLKAEDLLLDKLILTTNISKQNTIKSLSIITGKDLNTDTEFKLPVLGGEESSIQPLLKSFEAQLELSDASISSQTRNKYPKLSLFAVGGYGRPGYDMMHIDLHSYGMVGLNFSWNFLDWGINNKKREKAEVNSKIIEASKDVYLKQNQLEIENTQNEIFSIEKQIELDQEIIKLKEDIANSSWSKFQNGTIRSNDYLKDFNDLKKAQLSLELNKIQLIKKQVDLQHQKGILY